MLRLQIFFTLLLITLFSQAFAEDFSIGQPFFIVTEKLLSEGRANAVAHSQALLRNPGDVVIGNPNGKVTLVQFLDFICPLSEKMDPTIQQLIEGNPDLRVVYKPYPIHGKMSDDSAQAALSAFAQGKYQDFHAALMNEHGNLSDAKIIALAKQQGLNADLIQQAMTQNKYAAQIASSKTLAKELGIPGTPALFIMKTDLTSNGKPSDVIYILGTYSEDDFQKVVDKMLK
jgi:protein-disulfide isomerase